MNVDRHATFKTLKNSGGKWNALFGSESHYAQEFNGFERLNVVLAS
jgi:hypothetical protein